MIAGSDRPLLLWWLPRFDSPGDAGSPERLHRLGRYGKAAGFPAFSRRLCCERAGGVMVRANWSRIATRNRMRRQGVEDVKGATPIAVPPPKQPRRKLSKAELREQAAAAFLAWRAGQAPKDK